MLIQVEVSLHMECRKIPVMKKRVPVLFFLLPRLPSGMSKITFTWSSQAFNRRWGILEKGGLG